MEGKCITKDELINQMKESQQAKSIKNSKQEINNFYPE